MITNLDEKALFGKKTFEALLPLMDNYIPEVTKEEDHTAEEQSEEDLFLNAIVESEIMQETIRFLIQKKYFQDIEGAKNKLRELWFMLYDRDGTSKDVLGSRLDF